MFTRPIETLSTTATNTFNNFRRLTVSRPVRTILNNNTPNRLNKFGADFPNQVRKIWENQVQPPFTSPAPYIQEGTLESEDLYWQNGNPPAVKYQSFIKKKNALEKSEENLPLVRLEVPPNFYSCSGENDPDHGPLVIDERIDAETLKRFKTNSEQQSYIIHNNKKYWLPHTKKSLDAAINAQKFHEFLCFNPLNAASTIDQANGNLPVDITSYEVLTRPERKKRNMVLSNRYKKFNRGLSFFRLLGVSHYNLHFFKDFIFNNMLDMDNLYQLYNNKQGYKAIYLIPLVQGAQNVNDFLQNRIVQFYTQDFDVMVNALDPWYRRLKGEVNQSLVPPPSLVTASQADIDFLTTSEFSLKKERNVNQIKEYYLEVVFFSECQRHNDIGCAPFGWKYRPSLWGKLITIDIVSDLDRTQRRWRDARVKRKNEEKIIFPT